ncbi:MAG: acyl-CoA thioesterase [Candidatus Obscuribacterales bacterium]|nr:acyl-CoA thioesterase [Candidatus Obscuribacterales bacterium]
MSEKVSHRDPAIRIVLLPRDTNANGTIFGGIILSHIDLAGAVEVRKHTNQRIVTVAMKEVIFKEPVFVGEVVSFYTETIRTGRTSVTVKVDVEADRNGHPVKVTEAELTFVAVDEQGKPTEVKRIN